MSNTTAFAKHCEKGVKKMNRHKVVSAIYDDNKISALKTDNDETIYGKKFISTIHPPLLLIFSARKIFILLL
ncbi:MAG: hypothetical protein R2847_09355 [Bacteroidia bacterium]